MAIIKLSGVASKISGKLGGSVFGTSNSGSYIKQNAYSQQKNSPAQSVQRTKIQQVTQLWRSLTQAQKDAWKAQTVNYPYTNRVGDIVNYTAFQLFNKLNLNLQVIGYSPNLNVPAFVAVNLPDFLISQNPANKLVYGVQNAAIGATVSVFCASPRLDNLMPTKSSFKFIQSNLITAVNETFGMESNYTAVFGIIPSGTKIYGKIKVYDTNSGNVTDFSSVDVVDFV